ncbi:hypothetical protein NHP190002_08400 [Helicobacter ailurogastricus]|uniref:hypothetical protein n=1 Tax=Helicobacter ailurogastricus TaxID=1578720 RepID=UPI00244D8679|nr:hypothetical protein [Helicobacter ailurogastricus]GMB90156.1 hypothetical protein NHP190002_08400 [Helicobacter ailurogastricus]
MLHSPFANFTGSFGGVLFALLALMCSRPSVPLKWKPASTRRVFLSGFLTNILNPKAMLCLAAFSLAVALLFSNKKVRTHYDKHYKAADYLCALILSAFALYILASHIRAWV